MKTLHLILKKQWFDMILAGEKLEEYRELKEYYYKKIFVDFSNSNWSITDYDFKHFDTITFSHGYAKNRRQFVVKLKEIEIDKGRHQWGAEYGKYYFVFKLGEIISKNKYI